MQLVLPLVPTRNHSRLIVFYLFQHIKKCVSSAVKLYANDTKIYRQIVDPIKDPQLLQIDLSNVMEWGRKWQLRFNVDKCESLRITVLYTQSISLLRNIC